MTTDFSHPEVHARGRPVPFLIVAILVGLAPFYLLGLDVPWRGPASSQTPLNVATDKRLESYSASITGRKVVFIGGSNMMFGIRAPSLEGQLDVPVVNYALNAGLGIDLISERAMRDVRAGDLVVLASELSQFRVTPTTEPALRSDWIRARGTRLRDRVAEFPGRQWLLAREGCRMVRRKLEGWVVERAFDVVRGSRRKVDPLRPTTPYAIESFDNHGNLIFPRPAPRLDRFRTQAWPARQYNFTSSMGVRTLHWLSAECAARGATLLVMPGVRVENGDETPQARGGLRAREEEWLRIAQGLGAIRLLEPGQTTFPPELGYDTTHHMNDLGVARLEAILVPALRSALARNAGPG